MIRAATARTPGPTRPCSGQLRAAARRGRRTLLGQALIEFALVLPVFVLVSLLFIQLCILGVTWARVNNVAGAAARQAAAHDGETGDVDRALLSIAGANGLRANALWVEIDTDAGAGQNHRADQAQASDAPPPAGYNGTVTVHLTYQAPLLFSVFGGTVALGASYTEQSIGAYGGVQP